MSRWLEYFPLEQFHFVNGERLVLDPVSELRQVEAFLGLPPRINAKQFYWNHTRGFYCIRGATPTQGSTPGVENKKDILLNDTNVLNTGKLETGKLSGIFVGDRKSEVVAKDGGGKTEDDVTVMSLGVSPRDGFADSSDIARSGRWTAGEGQVTPEPPQTAQRCLAASKGRVHPEISRSVIRTLRRYFRPHNERFYNMVRVDFKWDKQ